MKKGRKKGLAILICGVALAGILAAALHLNWPEADDTQAQEVISVNVGENGAAVSGQTGEAAQKSVDMEKKDKEETVNVKAAADGTVQEITVNTVLNAASEVDGEIRDVSDLREIKNTKGDEEYTEENGTIIWQSNKEAIEYEGKSDAPLPVNVKISYYLDGRKMQPEDMAGKGGSVKIRFDYENTTSETVEVEGKQKEVQVPFTVVSMMLLSEDVFSNVKVENGKLISISGETMLVGAAFPGMEDCLHLKDYEVTEDIELPEYVEMTADVTDFELSFTATVVSPGLFEDFDTADLEDIEELPDSMQELNDASAELVEAAGELVDASASLREYLGTYMSGVDSLDEGTGTLLEGVSALNENKSALEEGAKSLEEGLSQLNSALKQISVSDQTESESGTEALETAMKALAADAQTMSSLLTAMETSLTSMESFAKEAAQYQTSVEQITGEVKTLLSALNTEGGKTQAADIVNKAAREQATAAAAAALGETELSEAQKQQLAAQIADSLDLTAAVESAWDSSQTSVQQTVAAVLGKLEEMPALEIPKTSMDISGIQAALLDMQKQLKTVSGFTEEISGMQKSTAALGKTIKQIKTAVTKLSKGSGSLTKGISAYNQGVQQVYEGVKQLNGGSAALAEAGNSILEGADALKEGMEVYRDGVKLFDEDGIQKLTELGDESLLEVTIGIRALKEADSRYINYGGIADGMTGSVVFLIETEEIKSE